MKKSLAILSFVLVSLASTFWLTNSSHNELVLNIVLEGLEKSAAAPRYSQKAKSARLIELDRANGSYILFLDEPVRDVSCNVNDREKSFQQSEKVSIVTFTPNFFANGRSRNATLYFEHGGKGKHLPNSINLTVSDPLIYFDDKITMSFNAQISSQELREIFHEINYIPNLMISPRLSMNDASSRNCRKYAMNLD